MAVSAVFQAVSLISCLSGNCLAFLAVLVLLGSFCPLVGPSWSVLPVSGHFCPIWRVSGLCLVRNGIKLMVAHSPHNTPIVGSRPYTGLQKDFHFYRGWYRLLVVACCLLATIWRPTWRVITIHKPICTSSVTPKPTLFYTFHRSYVSPHFPLPPHFLGALHGALCSTRFPMFDSAPPRLRLSWARNGFRTLKLGEHRLHLPKKCSLHRGMAQT